PKVRLSTDEQTVLNLTNAARAKKKLPPLTANAALCGIARAYAADVARRDKLGDARDIKTLNQRLHASDYRPEQGTYSTGYEPTPNALAMVARWMASPGDRKNILNERFQDAGIGIARSATGTVYYIQFLARPRQP
ncbi:MAG TPA: CAP domain-containing protein, partial [Gemmataceae bacterium]|nr:CAP domain-containing protein [Gemmataceae bacterium]